MGNVNVNQKYFRPSHLPALNYQVSSTFFHPYYKVDVSEIQLPQYLTTSPEATIINYYSVLMEAAIFPEGKVGGCGTVGMATLPYPIAYHFLTESYQKKVNYNEFVHSFNNIAHINLIKLQRIYSHSNSLKNWRYFIELETIEGSAKDVTYFAYYYGYITVLKETDGYKINNIVLHGEDFLCAAYHGWDHNAESVIEAKYGNWCKLVKTRYPTIQSGYVKNIVFTGTDGFVYLFIFFELTNGTDIEVAQYRQNLNGSWTPIKLIPEKCVEDSISPSKKLK
ncbi:hypothetical protein BFG57_10835 [Bacillus solimangrovi]|uniref:Uncharacterized protein n=1 Tax=Bacillus solimangrovi TaxID=1305675 RepID=A0A1E5LIG2_9BACI|nr:hypothetical protein BFG57_10835 [Bacillus solimangrovi]